MSSNIMITLLSKSASVSFLEINVPIVPFFDEAVDLVPSVVLV
jgi:hypothetical protein